MTFLRKQIKVVKIGKTYYLLILFSTGGLKIFNHIS